jgi:molybdate transport system substrate-binding protein
MAQPIRRLGFAGLALLLVLGFALVGTACGDDAGPDPTPDSAAATPGISGTITVFAAASLTDAFSEMAAEFERANPGVEVTFNFAGSSALRAQLEQGARADVFASADTAQMNTAKQNGAISGTEKVFARNSLVIITPKANPGGLATPKDLGRSGLKLVLAAPEVPVGNYSRQMFMNMDRDAATYGAGFNDAVLKNLASNESNVRQVVAKIELGEGDAGVVYGTDVTASVAPNLNVIQVPNAVNVIAEYPIAVVRDGSNTRGGQAFMDFVLSPAGQTILKKHGFVGI